MSNPWIPRWRQRELASRGSGTPLPTMRFGLATRKADLLDGMPEDRPSAGLSALVLESMGAYRAANLHRMREGDLDPEIWCSPRIFYDHAFEEETIVFPRLLTLGRTKGRNDVVEAVYHLLEDHATVVDWATMQAVPVDLIKSHAEIEDGLLWEFRSDLAPDVFPPGTPTGAEPVVLTGNVGHARRARVGIDFTVAKEITATLEKFADPLYITTPCVMPGAPYHFTSARWSTEDNQALLPYPAGYDGNQGLGYEYLGSVPRNAEARIAAMRDKINTDGGSRSETIDTMFGVSSAMMRQVGIQIGSLYDRAMKLGDTGSDLGWNDLSILVNTPKDVLKKNAPDVKYVMDVLGAGGPEFLKQLWSKIAPEMLSIAKKAVSSISDTFVSSSHEYDASIASGIPVVGAVISTAIQLFSDWSSDQKRRMASACATGSSWAVNTNSKTLNLGVPILIHLLDTYNVFDCPEDRKYTFTWNQDMARDLSRDNLRYLVGMSVAEGKSGTASKYPGLPISMQVQISNWWNLAIALMSHPHVEPVFRALGRDIMGGGIASDEQVLLVAAPIAVSNGLDVDSFARRLWERASGWRSRPELFIKKTYYDLDADGIASVPVCTVEAGNALQIQWGVLAEEAFKLVDDIRSGRDNVSLSLLLSPDFRPLAEKNAEKKVFANKNTFYYLAGGGAGATLAFVGSPLFVAALPLLAAYGYVRYRTKQEQAAQEQAEAEQSKAAAAQALVKQGEALKDLKIPSFL